MRPQTVGLCLVAGLSVAGCASTEGVRFQALAQQEALVRDGRAALVSKKQNSIVLISPAGRQMQAGRRPIYVVGLFNKSGKPLDFRVADVTVTQNVGGRFVPLPVVPYEQLVQEERARQVISAVLVGAAAAGNAYSASRAGYGSGNSTIVTNHGMATVHTNFYDPTAAAIATNVAAAQNEAMIAGAVATGQANMAALEKGVIKDNTLLPGEWYGGQLHFAPPETDASGPKTYRISIPVGGDVHEIEVTQGAVTS